MGEWPKDFTPFGTIGGVDAVQRLTDQAIRHGLVWFPEEKAPNQAQISMVLHGLADHTSIMQALKFAPEPDGPWPEATSVGRWLHAYGDAFGDRYRKKEAR